MGANISKTVQDEDILTEEQEAQESLRDCASMLSVEIW